MKKPHASLIAASLLLAMAGHVHAQDAAKPPGDAASAPATRLDGRPAPRLLTPSERREAGEPVNENLPEGKAVPQVVLPIGPRPPAPAASAPRPSRRGAVADEAARCQAEESDLARARCRETLARERRSPR